MGSGQLDDWRVIRLAWVCDHCGHRNKWRWERFDDPHLVDHWHCGKCKEVSVFEMEEVREGDWRRKK